MLASQLLIRTLRDTGCRFIHTVSGNQIMPVFDACIDSGIRLVHTRHEAAAVFMAEAHAQLTGCVGVALVTAAPGFANCVGALYSAQQSETPLLLLSGDSPVSLDGRGAFQEFAQSDTVRWLVKSTTRVMHADMLLTALKNALRLACQGRPGPVHLALPFDVLKSEVESPVLTRNNDTNSILQPDPTHIAAVQRCLAAARHPLILTGPSLSPSRQPELIAALLESTGVPVINLESPRGLNDPALGAFAKLIGECDCLLLLGRKPDFQLRFLADLRRDAVVMVIDPDPLVIRQSAEAIGRQLAFSAPVETIVAARQLAESKLADSVLAPDWSRRINSALNWRPTVPVSPGLNAASLVAAVQRQLERHQNLIVVADGGEFGQWAQSLSRSARRIINGPSGAIGGGLPYGIAASITDPDALVVVFLGDGTVGFHLAEFETAARENAALLVVIGNDSRWNAEYLIQSREYGEARAIACTLTEQTGYHACAEALGCQGVCVNNLVELDRAVEHAITLATTARQTTCINAIMQGLPAPTAP